MDYNITGIRDDSKSNTGTVAGIIVVCVFLVVSTIIGLIFYLRRRKREVEPAKEFEKATQNRVSETSTTWTELDVPSNRSSGRSTTDFTTAAHDVELQPQNMFPLTPVEFSLYDDPELEDQNLTKNKTTNQENNESKTTLKSSSERKEKQVKNVEVSDKRIENILENDDNNWETGQGANNGKDENTKDHSNLYSEEGQCDTVSLNTDNADDYEDMEGEQSNTEYSKLYNSTINNDEDNIGTDDDGDDIYVNVTSDNLGTNSSKLADIKNQNGSSEKNISLKEDKFSRLSKAPIPQPRVSLKNSLSIPSAAELGTNDIQHNNAWKQTNASTPERSLNNPENIDNDTYDDDLCDYDSVDKIYDYPRNNKSIHEESEKL